MPGRKKISSKNKNAHSKQYLNIYIYNIIKKATTSWKELRSGHSLGNGRGIVDSHSCYVLITKPKFDEYEIIVCSKKTRWVYKNRVWMNHHRTIITTRIMWARDVHTHGEDAALCIHQKQQQPLSCFHFAVLFHIVTTNYLLCMLHV